MPFSQANFNGYATGDELHLGLPILSALSGLSGGSGVSLDSLDQALSSASTSTAGLTSSLKSELGTVIQPAQASSVKAFNLGSGLNLDLGAIGNTITSTVNSLLATVNKLIPLPSISIAPPNALASKGELGPIDIAGLLHLDTLGGEAQAAWPGEACPTGNLSYGLGYLAGASLLPGLPAITSAGVTSLPLLSTSGSGGLAVNMTKSLTNLVTNGDGSYGIQTQASDIIAPLTVNLFGLATLNIGVHAANGNLDPVTLTATTSGEKSVPASLKLSTDDILDVQLSALNQTVSLVHIPLTAIGAQGLHIQLTLPGIVEALANLNVPSLITSTLQQVIDGLNQLAGGSSQVSQLTGALSGVVGQLDGILGSVGNQASSLVNTLVNQPLAPNLPSVEDLLKVVDGIVHLNFGTLDVDTVPHAIGGPWSSAPLQSADGTQAAGALDLLNLKLGLTNSYIDLGAGVNALGNLISQIIPAGTIPNLTQNLPIPTLPKINLPDIPLANPVLGHLEAASNQQSPIACATALPGGPNPQQNIVSTPGPTPKAPSALPFTGGPGGFWQPMTGVAFLGAGGGTLALLRRLRKRSAA